MMICDTAAADLLMEDKFTLRVVNNNEIRLKNDESLLKNVDFCTK